MKKILVCGGREWHLADPIYSALSGLLELTSAQNIMIIHGGARGADIIAGSVGKQLGMAVARVDADWDYYHKAAGAIRNKWMASLNPDYVLAYVEDFHASKGTKNMVNLAKSSQAAVRLYTKSKAGHLTWYAYMRSQGTFVEVESPWITTNETS